MTPFHGNGRGIKANVALALTISILLPYSVAHTQTIVQQLYLSDPADLLDKEVHFGTSASTAMQSAMLSHPWFAVMAREDTTVFPDAILAVSSHSFDHQAGIPVYIASKPKAGINEFSTGIPTLKMNQSA